VRNLGPAKARKIDKGVVREEKPSLASGEGSAVLLIFDIDGTLLQVDEARVFRRVFREHYGHVPEFYWEGCRPATDVGITRHVLSRFLGREASIPEVESLLDRFVVHLDEMTRTGVLTVREIEGASAFLERVMGAGVPTALATGSIEPSARIKLARAGLDRFFPCGAFCRGTEERSEILMSAVRGAAEHYERVFAPSEVVYFGDGLWDVEAVGEVGMGFVGVATSPEREEALRAAGATTIIRNYLEPLSLDLP